VAQLIWMYVGCVDKSPLHAHILQKTLYIEKSLGRNDTDMRNRYYAIDTSDTLFPMDWFITSTLQYKATLSKDVSMSFLEKLGHMHVDVRKHRFKLKE